MEPNLCPNGTKLMSKWNDTYVKMERIHHHIYDRLTVSTSGKVHACAFIHMTFENMLLNGTSYIISMTVILMAFMFHVYISAIIRRMKPILVGLLSFCAF